MARRNEERHMFRVFLVLLLVMLGCYAHAGKCPEPQVKVNEDTDKERAVGAATNACKERYGSNVCVYNLEQFPDGGFSVVCGPEQESNQ